MDMSESCGNIYPNMGEYIAQVAGPRLVGILLVWGLFGVLSIQVYLYFQTFSKDKPALRALVCIVYLLQAAQTILLTKSQWKSFINGLEDAMIFGLLAASDDIEIVWSDWLSLYIIGGSVALLVQQFYVYRIYVISQNKAISGSIMLMSLSSFAGALTVAAEQASIRILPNQLRFSSTLFSKIAIWLSLGSACDIMIVVSMCYYLQKRAKGSPFPKTHALISKIVHLTVETGALTASMTILVLTIFVLKALPQSLVVFYFSAPLFVLASIYSTTMMAVLNSRIKLGVISDSSTWLDNELMSHKQEVSGIVFGTGPPVKASRDIGVIFVPMEQSATSDKLE